MSVAVIGGSGTSSLLSEARITERLEPITPFGKPSSAICKAVLRGTTVFMLYRHGVPHAIPPHAINYRANIWALNEIGVRTIVAVAAVGGIRQSLKPGDLIVPDQLIDYTWGRESTFFDGLDQVVGHLEMTEPYSPEVRKILMSSSAAEAVPLEGRGVYAVTQGPRFETPAEIDRIERDGGDIVGMTGMPEAALAAEKSLRYGCIAVVVNRAAGRGDAEISSSEIEHGFVLGIDRLNALLPEAIKRLDRLSETEFQASILRP